jgi:hypothetical protein
MSLVRTLLFIALTCVYLVACPLLVLYALGYIYNPVEPGFVRTGMIELVTVPSGAEVFLEGSRFVRTTPALMEELLPGQYSITLRKKGYKPWQHSVSVTAGKAVAFKDIVLLPENWQEKTLTQSSNTDLVPMDTRCMFIVRAGPRLGDCLMFMRDGLIRPVLPAGSPFAAYDTTKIDCVPDSEVLLAGYDGPGRHRSIYVDLGNREPNAIDISDFLRQGSSFVTWSPDDPTRVFAVNNDCVSRIDVERGRSRDCYVPHVRGLGIYANWLYVIDGNDAISRVSFEKRHSEEVWRDASMSRQLFSQSDFYDIRIRKKGLMFFLGSKGDLVANIPPYHIASSGVRDITFDGRQDTLAWWTATSIGEVDFARSFDRTIFHEMFRFQTVYQGGKDIRQVFWAYKGSHILFNDNDDIYLLELQPQPPHRVEHITRVLHGTSIYYDSDEKTLYYLDRTSGQLKQLQLIGQ